ncbi:MAG: PH domain-containing protein [Propionibacteriaceae bacterium]|nr:PH domain-containing protein [Propionibacteriaceae bacterium]
MIERPHPLTGLARGGIALVAGLYFVTQELVDGSRGSIRGSLLFVGLGLLGVALLAGISGIFTWRTTTFVADDEEFRIERNFLSRQSSKVDYTKVQSVDVSQPFIARLMGLAKVHIDVGGAGGLDIAFLSKARAESLREHLVERMHRAQLPSPAEPGLPSSDPSAPAHFPPPVLGPDGVPAVAPPPAHAPAQEELVIAVPPSNLLLGTFVSLSTGFALLGAVVLVAIALIAKTPVTLLAAMLGVGGWVWRQTGSNWNFRMTKRDGALRLTRGLLSTTAQGLRPGRIQGVAIKQDLLQRVTGLYQMTVTVLGYGDPTGEENRQTNAVILPFGTWGEVLTVLRAIWPEVDLTQVQPHPQSPKAKWLTPITFSTHTWGIGEHVVVTTHGLLERVTTIVPHRRMQSASIHQGPIQRRLKVASVHVHTTDGPVNQRLYHLDEAVARQVFEEQVARAREARASAA